MINIYVLELEGGNYYVGKTRHTFDRFDQHRAAVVSGSTPGDRAQAVHGGERVSAGCIRVEAHVQLLLRKRRLPLLLIVRIRHQQRLPSKDAKEKDTRERKRKRM